MTTINAYSRLDPVMVTDEGKVLELFKGLVSDAEIHVIRKDVGDETFLGFWAEDSVQWKDKEGPIMDFLHKLRPLIKLGFGALYKEVVIKELDGQVDFEAFAWLATRNTLTSINLDDIKDNVKLRFYNLYGDDYVRQNKPC